VSPLFRRQPVERTRSGDFEVRLDDGSREVLRSVAGQLRELLDAGPDDPSLRRLFPVAYADDPDREADYRRLVGDELAQHRRAALETFAATAGATRLTEEEVVAWMGAVNDLRLVLGTRLDVSEDMDPLPDPTDPDAPLLALYGFLGYLLESIVDALAAGLEEPG
jgi:hypothetical protein